MPAKAETMNEELNDFLNEATKGQQEDATSFLTEDLKPTEQVAKTEEPVEKDDEPRKNRRHRRLEEQLAREREARVAAEARAEALSESRQFAQEVGNDEISLKLARLYGTDDNGKQAAQLTKELLEGVEKRAEERATKRMEEATARAKAEEKAYSQFLDTKFEEIEDEYDVDITSNSPAARKARTLFVETLQKFSPKDDEGNVKEYADFGSTWEVVQAQLADKKSAETSERQKDLASRSMTKSGAAIDSPKMEDDAMRRQLREMGIRV